MVGVDSVVIGLNVIFKVDGSIVFGLGLVVDCVVVLLLGILCNGSVLILFDMID